MKKLIPVYKPIGLTPLQLITKFRQQHQELKNQKIAYAGRLDPMAHGVLLLMIANATKQRDQYLNLDKEYTFKALFGITTDTYDILGIPRMSKSIVIQKELINKYLQNLPQIQDQPYPPYSSKTVNGKPLFWWSRQDKLSQIKIPSRQIKIHELKLLSLEKISKNNLEKLIYERIKTVKGDFRQEAILESWSNFFHTTNTRSFSTAKLHLTCSSGTYVRTLTHTMGQTLNTGAITLDILRTKVGKYTLNKSLRLKS